jgi:hypothetical protein
MIRLLAAALIAANFWGLWVLSAKADQSWVASRAHASKYVMANGSTPTALPAVNGWSGPASGGFSIKADGGNAGVTYVGDCQDMTISANNAFPLKAGESVSVPMTNITSVCVSDATNTDIVWWIGG